MALTFLLGAAAAVAVGGYAWLRTAGDQSGVRLSWACPRCDKRVRYSSCYAGRTVACPACRRPLALPRSLPQTASGVRPVTGYRLRRKPADGQRLCEVSRTLAG
jgi:LSD1 subclass zinc finger protein